MRKDENIEIVYPPYSGVTDYPRFDYKKKTISCLIPKGEFRRTSMEVYGISKRRKAMMIINQLLLSGKTFCR